MNTTQTGRSALRRTVRVGTVIMAVSVAVVFGTPIHASADVSADVAAKAVRVAAAQKNKPYKYGATGPAKYDCSGLTQYSYKKAGKSLARTAQGQYNTTTHITPAHRKVGDLVLLGRTARSIYHVGIYAGWKDGKGWMWNANTGAYRGRKVVLAPISEYTKGAPKAYYGRVK